MQKVVIAEKKHLILDNKNKLYTWGQGKNG